MSNDENNLTDDNDTNGIRLANESDQIALRDLFQEGL